MGFRSRKQFESVPGIFQKDTKTLESKEIFVSLDATKCCDFASTKMVSKWITSWIQTEAHFQSFSDGQK